MLKFLDFLIENKQGGMTLAFLSLSSVYFAQDKIVYFPEVPGEPKSNKENPFKYRSPAERNIPFDDVTIKTSDGVILKGWLLKQASPNKCPTIIFFHGNAGNIGTRLDFLEMYYRVVKVNLLIVAYRGYSESTGTPSEKGLQIDSIAMLKFCFESKDIDTKNIFTHGRSLGGATSIYGVKEGKFNVAGMIIDSTFSSIPDLVFDFYLPNSKPLIEGIIKNFWNSERNIKGINVPMLFIKSLKDEIVSPEMMTCLYNSSDSLNKKMYEIPNGGHNDNWFSDPLYFSELMSFIYSNNKF